MDLDTNVKKIIVASVGLVFFLIVGISLFFGKLGNGSSLVFFAFFGYFVFFVVRDKKLRMKEENDFLNFKREKSYLDYI
jgi:hypothetical protein